MIFVHRFSLFQQDFYHGLKLTNNVYIHAFILKYVLEAFNTRLHVNFAFVVVTMRSHGTITSLIAQLPGLMALFLGLVA